LLFYNGDSELVFTNQPKYQRILDPFRKHLLCLVLLQPRPPFVLSRRPMINVFVFVADVVSAALLSHKPLLDDCRSDAAHPFLPAIDAMGLVW
jgi:hypothetical protein